ncbi:phage tail tape measure protein, partial [Myxococcota bacterium]|nr:phage tail tape measure protein [Myxococcota bacterium]
MDRVSAPARSLSKSILGINNAISNANGQRPTFSARLDDAMARNNAALDQTRGRLFDAVAGFYALRTAIAAPVREAAAFESAMADVRKVVDFASEQEFKAFRDELLALSRQVPVSVNGLAQIAAAAGAAGIAGDDLVTFTEAAAKIGVAFDISADQAGEGLAKLMTGLGITLPEAIKLADAMNHLSNAQASSADEIFDVVRRVGAQAKMFGFTAEQTSAFASAMIAAGAESEVAATSFRNMGKALTRGGSATDRQKDAFKALGMDAGKVAAAMQKDAVKTTVSVLEALSQIPKEQQAAIASDLFGDEARALGPLLTNLDLVRSSLGLVADESKYAGSSFKEFETRSKTFEARLQKFTNVITALKITIGNALLPVLTELMDSLTPIIDTISGWITKNPELTAGIIAAGAAVVGLRIALSALSFVGLLGRGGALSLLAFGMNTVGAASGRVYGAARSAIALQTALAAMDGAKIGLLTKIGAGLRGIAAATGLTAISGAISAVVAAIAAISAPVWLVIAAAVAAVGMAWKYWDRVSSFVSGVGSALGELLAPALEKVRPLLEWFAPFGEIIAAGWERAKTVLSAVGDWLGTIFQKETLSEEDKAAAHKAGYDFVMAIWDGMKAVMSGLTSWVSSSIQGLVDSATSGLNSLAGWAA